MDVNTNFMKTIITSATIVFIVGLFHIINLLVYINLVVISEVLAMAVFFLFSFLSFVVIPTMILQLLSGDKLYLKNRIFFKRGTKYLLIKFCMIIVAVILVKVTRFKVDIIIFNIIIACCEEFLFREILYEYLGKTFGIIATCIINALIFAMILHLNCNIAQNIFIRFPLGIVLGIVRNRVGLFGAIVGHWAYNILILSL